MIIFSTCFWTVASAQLLHTTTSVSREIENISIQPALPVGVPHPVHTTIDARPTDYPSMSKVQGLSLWRLVWKDGFGQLFVVNKYHVLLSYDGSNAVVRYKRLGVFGPKAWCLYPVSTQRLKRLEKQGRVVIYVPQA